MLSFVDARRCSQKSGSEGAATAYTDFEDSNSCAGCAPVRMKTGSLRTGGGSAPPARTLPASAKRTLRRMKTAVLLPLSVSASESGSQSQSLSVFGARHDLSGSITIADCGCDADTDSDPDGLLS